MKKWITIIIVILIGLSSINYYSTKKRIPTMVIDVLSEKFECKGYEVFGGTLPLEFFWSNEYYITVYLNSSTQKFVEVPIRIVDPSSPLMRVLGLHKFRFIISKDEIPNVLKYCSQ